ncbi:MAG: hypothetical protein DWQ49_06045 [Bacteroidetes bacterium]|nr:MAG: hypothetical protein DWQ49_06045 [Bacteroidota bacterium]
MYFVYILYINIYIVLGKMKKLVIGIGGVARSGKDTFAKLLKTELKSVGYSCESLALADPLKRDIDGFCWSNFGISAFTDKTEEKDVIRDLMVGFGNGKRKISEGKYFTRLAESRINSCYADVAIVTDIRFDEYEEDEVFWVKQKMNGVLTHVARFDFAVVEENEEGQMEGLNQRTFVEPANETERINDPKIRDAADFSFNWPTFEEDYERRCLPYVEKFVQWMIDRRRIEIK